MCDPLPLSSSGFSINMRNTVGLKSEGALLYAIIHYLGKRGPFATLVKQGLSFKSHHTEIVHRN
jgi:hypothetical protein